MIGAATGYAAALLARLARAWSRSRAMPASRHRPRQSAASFSSAMSPCSKASRRQAIPPGAPYDVIVIDGRRRHSVPDALARQLAEGGRLVTVLKPRGAMGQARGDDARSGGALVATRGVRCRHAVPAGLRTGAGLRVLRPMRDAASAAFHIYSPRGAFRGAPSARARKRSRRRWSRPTTPIRRSWPSAPICSAMDEGVTPGAGRLAPDRRSSPPPPDGSNSRTRRRAT